MLENSGVDLPPFIQEIQTRLPELVDRKTASRVCGGAVSPRTLANFDSAGKGPATRLRMGKIVMYPRAAFVEWLAQRSTVEEG